MKAVHISIGANYGHSMDDAAASLREEGFKVEITGADACDMDADVLFNTRILDEVRKADILFVRVHGDVTYFKKFDLLKKTVCSSGIPMFLLCESEEEVTAEYRKMFTGTQDDYSLLLRLMSAGGDANYRSMLIWALNRFDGTSVPVPEPVFPPAEGAMTLRENYLDIEDALDSLPRDRPRICVFFHQKFWVSGNTGGVKGLLRALEERGAAATGIFTLTYPDSVCGASGICKLIDRYLIKNGKPAVDCIIQTMGYSQTLKPKADDFEQKTDDDVFIRLGIPVIQAMHLYGPRGKWENDIFGLDASEVAGLVVSTEYDGQLITVPIAGYEVTEEGRRRYRPIEDRCRMVADTAYLWAQLGRKTNTEKKAAVLLYMYPPRNDLAGGASGLDTMESVADLLKAMSKRGYSLDWIPENGKELSDRLLGALTNDDSWLSERDILERAADTVSPGQYSQWMESFPEHISGNLIEGWGEPPGDLHTAQGKILIPGLINGNVFVGFQPDRGKCDSSSYHDPKLAPPHQYIAFYRWLRYVFGADAVIHMGTHGTQEWLPGKSVGLTQNCFPDAVLDGLPDIYPYIIDNPGEGMQAKRRGYAAVVTHMIPAMARADTYDKIGELESALQLRFRSRSVMMDESTAEIDGKIAELVKTLEIDSDLNIPDGIEEIAARADDIYDYVVEIKDALMSDGLHILGRVPEGSLFADSVYSMVRNANGNVPSLRDSVARSRGYDFQALLQNPSGTTDGRLNGAIVDEIDEESRRITEEVCEGKNPEIPGSSDTIDFMRDTLIPALNRTGDEIESVLNALEGKFIPPGPSGCPTRGRASILPTGRNFYSIDPDGIPWTSSWKIGCRMADQMIQRYIEEEGRYPKSVGVVVWATDTMRTGGDDIAYILWLMGLRPVWAEYGGRVTGLEIVPLEELGRPRLDVTLRISGLFRDAFQNLIDLIDGGVKMIADLDESEEDNYLAANLRKDMLDAILSGIPEDRARKESAVRIFGDAPGQYGCGVNNLITNGKWDTAADLGDAYIDHGCFAYGKGLSGQAMPAQFRRRMGSLDAAVKNHNNRENDLLDMDDDYDFLGGMIAASRSGGGSVRGFMGDSSDTENIKSRTVEEECAFVFRSKINNPKWFRGLQRHGFKGALEISQLFDYMMGWSATAGIIKKWMFDSVANNFVLDEEAREWFLKENPYAMSNMIERLEEAIQRGLWSADAEMKERLESVCSEVEEFMEEYTDSV